MKLHLSRIVVLSALATFGCGDASDSLDDDSDTALEQAMDGGKTDGGAKLDAGSATGSGPSKGGKADASAGKDAGASASGGDDAEPTDDATGSGGEPSSGGSGGISMEGTWYTNVDAKAEVTAPLVGTAVSDVKLALRLMVKESGGKLTADVSACNLEVTSDSLALNFDKVEPLIKLTESIPSFDPKVGGKVPLPNVSFVIGQDKAGTAVDADKDGKPGVTVGATALGAVPFDAHIGMVLNITMDATLTDEKTVSGTANFDANSKIFGSTMPLVTSGAVTVKQVQGPVKFAATHYAGDVPCAELLKK